MNINQGVHVQSCRTFYSFVAMTLTVFALAAIGPSFAGARSNAGGEYTYEGSPTDNRTTGQTGDQVYAVPSPITVASFWPGQTDDVDYWQIYKGASITDTGKPRVMRGNVVFENALIWNGTDNFIGLTGPVKLMLRNGGSLYSASADILIGRYYNAELPNGYASVFVDGSSSLASCNKAIYVGDSRPGALWIDGGTASLTNGLFQVGGGSGSATGYVRLNRGEISLRAESNVNAAAIGASADYSSVHISGGMMGTRRTAETGNIYFLVANGSNLATDIYVDGGLLDLWSERVGLGVWNNDVRGARASLTVDGDGCVSVGMPVLGKSGIGNNAAINLLGGRFELSRFFAAYGNTTNGRFLNFDGGTLALVYDARNTHTGYLSGDCGQCVVYPGGGTIDISSGIDTTVSASFRAAEGYGVCGIELTNPGSGYVTAPQVTITGGSGSNATAYAVLKKDRTIEKIVVTCRGEGYAADDVVLVGIGSTTGAGATATAALASNAGGILRKTGAGIWKQTTTDNAFGGEIEIVEGTLSPQGAGFTAATAVRMGEGTDLAPVKGTASSLNRLDVTNGVVTIAASGSSGTATLAIGSLSVNQGLALVTRTNGLALALTATDMTATSSSASPVVNGLVYASMDSSGYRTPLPIVRQSDGTLALAETTTAPGSDANWKPTGVVAEEDAPEVSAVNSIIFALSGTGDQYVRNTGLVEVKSGMFIVQRPHNGIVRMQVTGGGAFTTRAKGGMFVYGDTYGGGNRSNSTANNGIVSVGTWRRLFGPFADPDSATPMALTIAGVKASRPECGAQTWLLADQRFSGGLNLVNGGVFVASDGGLGASGGKVSASGYCSISAYNWAFDVSHPVELLDGSALIFSPSAATGNLISSSLSGSGDLLVSDINRGGFVMAFNGDHSAFVGDYYIQGNARIAPSEFSASAGICLADGTNGVGVVEASGSFTRSAGTGKGEVCWKTHKAYAALGYGLRGGFAAYGGDLTVNLGGAGDKLDVGSDYLPEEAVVQLQSQYADGALRLVNGFELGGRTQRVNVWTGKTATLAGAVSDAVGGGELSVEGDVVFAGTLEVSAENLSAPLLTVMGDIAFADGAMVTLSGEITESDLASQADSGVAIATATGTISGVPVLAAPSLRGWELRVRNGTLVLKKSRGMVISFR